MSILKAVVELLLDPDGPSVEAAADRHFAPGFRQRVNGAWVERRAFLAGMADLRATVERATITVLDELVDGRRYAERHRIDLELRDGARVRREVFVFAERDADGRFVRIEEASVAAAGEEVSVAAGEDA
ncbi:hypothetical protein [Patulibacter americanus]|uniref:hypothetical protein n=1 Tax=Patulibacter americanus TaxID=588672 RepID=UPI0003B40888|nr:hypothetical protein [Patulibacter americanus]